MYLGKDKPLFWTESFAVTFWEDRILLTIPQSMVLPFKDKMLSQCSPSSVPP